MFEIFIPCIPVAKARPRIGKFHAYTPKETRRFEKKIAHIVSRAYQGEPMEGPLGCSLRFILPRDSAASEKRNLPHVKPDSDNLLKAVWDSCEKILYKNDSQICWHECSKEYEDDEQEPGVHIKVFELGKISKIKTQIHL